MIFAALVSVVTVGLVLFFLDDILGLIGATGETAVKAKEYLVIILPSAPLMAMGMCGGAALRGVGDAKRSMSATLAGARPMPFSILSLSLVYRWGLRVRRLRLLCHALFCLVYLIMRCITSMI